LGRAFSQNERWAERVRAAIAALLAYGKQAPQLLRFLLVDAPSVGPPLVDLRRQALELLAAGLREGRTAYEKAADLTPATEQMILAGLAWRVSNALLDGEAESLLSLQAELVEFALTPYLGRHQARRMAAA
jgi:hypothetical protein